jgi:5'-3' exonuclease
MTTLSSINITLNSSKAIILIDQSYYIFNRYYATYNWYKRQSEEDFDHINITDNKSFILAFFRHFENDLTKLTKKFKTVKSNIVFCIDCSRADIWRNDIYPNYKITRTKKSNFNSVIFTLFKNYITNYNYNYCEYNNLEADDITYLVQKKLKMEIDVPKIVIITNDSDYLQMYDTNTIIQNMQFKDLSLRIKNNPIIELEFKIIYGDKSDNIQKIQTGLNKDNALKLSMFSDKERNAYLKKYNIEDNYNLNKRLVDLSCIPEILISEFYNKYNIIINKK